MSHGGGLANGDPTVAVGGGLCRRLAALQCEGAQRCCSAGQREVETCRSEAELDCTRSLYLDEIAASPQADFDARAAERVWADLQRRSLECDPSVLHWIGSEDGLRGIFRGTRALGEACDPSGGVTGDRGLIAAALSTCRLADGLACLPDGLFGAWSCAPRQVAGGSCLTDDNCQTGNACNNFSQAALGSCIARQPLGAPCANAGECASLYCDAGRCAAQDADAVYCPAP